MSDLRIEAGPFTFTARMETELAPRTCAAFSRLLPFHQKVIHVRWSGEACWIPLGDLDVGVGYENATSHPTPGQIILFPGGISETEILISYGSTAFGSIAGPLAGNHFLTIESDTGKLRELGQKCLWEGAHPIGFERVEDGA